MDNAKLLKLIEQDEGPKLDFKMYLDIGTESTKKELTKDVIAIANSYGGRGYLVLGVEDKTKAIIGVDPEAYSEERIQQIILNRCDPPVSIRVENNVIEDKTLCLITIFRSHNRPHQMRQTGAFYIRRGSTTDYARRNEIASMLQENSLMYDELVPVYHARIEHLNLTAVNHFVEKTTGERYRKGHEAILCDVGLLYHDREDGFYYPTIGGLLLFGNSPQLLLPHSSVVIAYYNEAGKLVQQRICGTIIEMLDGAMRFIGRQLKGTGYPLAAIEEALSNALVHRDYFDISRQILVVLGKKTVEISNPGPIYDANPLNNVMRSMTPKRRNNWLYHQLIIIDKKRRFAHYSRGLRKIKEWVLPFGKVKFINMRKRNLFKVILPGLDAVGRKN